MEICNSFKICPKLPVSDSLGLQMIEVFSDLLSLYVASFCVSYFLTRIVIFRGINYLDSIRYL